MRRLYKLEIFCLATLLVSVAWADQITLSTYYPAPHGVYREFVVTERQVIGDLDEDGEYTDDLAILPVSEDPAQPPILGSLVVKERVGIGTNEPVAELDVNGLVTRNGWIMCRRSNTQAGFSGTVTDIDWNQEIREDGDYYTHNNVVNPDNIIVLEDGWYRISYCINFFHGLGARSCFRVGVYDDASFIPGSLSQTYARFAEGRYVHCSSSFIAYIGANSIVDLRTDANAAGGAFGVGGCDYSVLINSQISIEKVDE